MAIGTLEVKLVSAKGLRGTDIFGEIDPYVLIYYNNQEHKSSVARDEGENPIWNEKFTFNAKYPGSSNDFKLVLKIMDHDSLSADDFIGEATIYVKELIELGIEKGKSEVRPQKYSVVGANLDYSGEIIVGVTFTLKVVEHDGGRIGRMEAIAPLVKSE